MNIQCCDGCLAPLVEGERGLHVTVDEMIVHIGRRSRATSDESGFRTASMHFCETCSSDDKYVPFGRLARAAIGRTSTAE